MSIRNPTISRPIYSQFQVETDQKDIIIGQLRQEIHHLQRNESQFYKLEDEYKALEYKYHILSEQKRVCDSDFKDRHQVAVRSIAQLRSELDALKTDLRGNGLEQDDLDTDYSTLRGQIDQRLIDIEKLKNQLHSLYADGDQLVAERQRLQSAATGLKGDNQILLNKVRSIHGDVEAVAKSTTDLDKYSKQLSNAQKLLKQKILAYEAQNNQLDQDINQVIEDLNLMDSDIHQYFSQIKQIQGQIAQVSALSDKYKCEALHYHKSQQGQMMRNNDLAKGLNQAEGTFKVRINQVEQGRAEITALKNENQSLEKVNGRLDDDIEFCRRHLQNLALLNQDLVQHLEKFSEDDQVVRNLINRRQRVERARVIVQETTRHNVKLSHNQQTTYGFNRPSQKRY